MKIPYRRDGEESSASGYWKREALAYQSGLLAHLPGGMAAPRCFSVEERPDGSLWLWLEEIRESTPGRWSRAQYVAAARHLGAFNGAYLTDLPLPAFSWLATGWLRSSAMRFSSLVGLLQDESTWQNPLIRAAYPVPPAADLLWLWADRERLLEALDRLPRTLCHLDAWRTNLFSRVSAEGETQTVAIDWAFTGIGAVGEEISPLVWICPPRFARHSSGWNAGAVRTNRVRRSVPPSMHAKGGSAVIRRRVISPPSRTRPLWSPFAAAYPAAMKKIPGVR